ncbi:hypothetical protein LX15_004608 [Streptoalloteichus tenebrarius]|uniref:WXG100 family type VII secretion target n=1 Tax=Streptoalloteichus tenebrarius (strain ATCC 17920 / DSM 40477 / JCM 4838 / CBS 697.72 / NBRC 16177 / NCIMB 11028 / NRRL B-12390 / A12253. 1 / ISP 5477) TaxID=1933 RepID=A0ABT1HZF0_STRSD|nr:hypothetical protein [Streptoalloteichus tenebrarius]MCP2260888.1 hypothetical protein [Streptoalloteichus tenebrarius]BFF03352.1 hypothetical protein GCM10020241_50270 [Streptoalloteichus tenebrarius]
MTPYADVEDPRAALKEPEARDRPGNQSSEELIKAAGWRLRSVNWVYEKIAGEDLIETLIKPLVGDFEKIDKNAAAWDNVAASLDSVRHNLNEGLKQLDPHWEGEAAQSFERHIQVLWTVAIEADSQLARIIGNKFQSVANTCRLAVKGALMLLDKLIDILIKAAIKACIPGPGWASAVTLVYDAINIVDDIRKLINSIQMLIEGVQTMIQGVKEMGTALMKLKDVRDLNDAADVLDDYQDGQQTYQDGAKAAKSGAFGAVRAGFKLNKHVKGARDSYNQMQTSFGNTAGAGAGGAGGAGAGAGAAGGGGAGGGGGDGGGH